MRWGFGLGVLSFVCCLSGVAHAELPRDYFLDPPTPGTYLLSDAYTVGGQLSVENRAHLEEGMSMLTTRVTGTASLPYGEGGLHMDARVFLFTLGGSVGYRHVWRNIAFDPGEARDRTARKQVEDDKAFDGKGFPYYEGRLRLTLPLDSFFMVNTLTTRYEGVADNTFDWFHANVHDGGVLYKYEGTLFFRHRDFGGIGPYFRWLSSPKSETVDGEFEPHRRTEWAVGLVYGTRPGLVRPRHGNSDLLLFQLVFEPGQGKTSDEFGLQGYQTKIPLYPLLVYRAALRL